MGIEERVGMPQGEMLNSLEKSEEKPFFGLRSVVKAKLDGSVPFEGAIDGISPKGDSFEYKVVGKLEDGSEVEEKLDEETLKRYNESELHLWQ